jgi:hypothetical protein
MPSRPKLSVAIALLLMIIGAYTLSLHQELPTPITIGGNGLKITTDNLGFGLIGLAIVTILIAESDSKIPISINVSAKKMKEIYASFVPIMFVAIIPVLIIAILLGKELLALAFFALATMSAWFMGVILPKFQQQNISLELLEFLKKERN